MRSGSTLVLMPPVMRPSVSFGELQLDLAAGFGQTVRLEVIVQVEWACINPDRMAKVERHQRQPLGKDRCQMQARTHMLACRVREVATALRQLEENQRPHVHGGFRCFYI